MFPSPESGVSFKLEIWKQLKNDGRLGFRPLKAGLVSNTIEILFSKLKHNIRFPSPESGVSFKQHALKPAPLLG